MEENKKKYDFKNIIFIITLVLLVVCLFKLYNMADDITSLENRVANYQAQINSLGYDIDSMYDNVDNLLKKQASLLSSVEYTLGELDGTTHHVPLTLKVIPKTLTDDTVLSVRIGATTADFTRDGDEFTVTVPVELFISEEQYPILSIKTGSETNTEKLENVCITNLHYDYLPNVYAHISPFYDYSNGKLKIDSDFQISIYSESSVSITKIELITEKNGEEIERKDVKSLIKEDSYEGVFNKTYSAKDGDEFKIYVIAEDSLGYIHKTTVLHCIQEDNGVYSEGIVDKGDEIYDKNGNLLTE
ncbi:MAG: hypothetical protein IJY23_02840 [Clostridia bacterium]|nr:hypothetical protein [Clostridia bacterium]